MVQKGAIFVFCSSCKILDFVRFFELDEIRTFKSEILCALPVETLMNTLVDECKMRLVYGI